MTPTPRDSSSVALPGLLRRYRLPPPGPPLRYGDRGSSGVGLTGAAEEEEAAAEKGGGEQDEGAGLGGGAGRQRFGGGGFVGDEGGRHVEAAGDEGVGESLP